MAKRKVGVWLIGAWGGVATTVVVGLAALRKGLSDTTGLVTALPSFAKLDLIGWDELVVGGHEIRETSYAAEAQVLVDKSHVFNEKTLAGISSQLAKFDRNIKPGTLVNVGAKIESLAGPECLKLKKETAAQAVSRLTKDIEKFKTAEKLDRVIVVNVSSTEPPPPDEVREWKWAEVQKSLASKSCPLPASTLYAIAAMQSGSHFVNFTPSVGSDLPGLDELALKQNVLHVGRDGKTGETLMKAVLAPMFAARNLKVMSWVGHNIFGNLDGKVLDDPVNKANKVKSKDHLLTEILGYKPQTLVSIEYIESMGDWKTAWDHIHFQGFLGTPMVLQFTWQGCDSLLAAPLVIDLIRLTEREARRGTSGIMSHLASFFKSPMGTDEPAFAYQFQQLTQWVDRVSGESDE
ncbi:inositol-3-phosphate synthase [Schlesneria paludicola]|uniref:inositol-3-phosphate synthase n=1 Tax=Schlesneria paludicola TaxID=360056 RepID=UPI00029B530B|nr:inositol-3-phosphate synthase [Schlesneria paludicola]